MYQITELDIPNVYHLTKKVYLDERGHFCKFFHNESFQKIGLPTSWSEDFYSVSKKNVIRGFHFQLPPYEHDKLIIQIKGRVLDVLLDLRIDSPTFKKTLSVELNTQEGSLLFIPQGVAHAFLSLEDESIMIYKTTSLHAPTHDTGVLYDSTDFIWPISSPIVSLKDKNLPPLHNFESPFIMRSCEKK